MKRGRPLARVSPKRAERAREREQIVMRAMTRDHFDCAVRERIPEAECHGRLDPHEIIPRSAWPEGIYDLDNVLTVCRRHHDWINANPTEAHDRGLHGYAHERTDDDYPEHH